MTVITKNIGRLPQNIGNYDSSKAYGKTNRVILYGCEWQSLIENNTHAPATLVNGVVTPDTIHWRLVSGVPANYGLDGKLSAETARAQGVENAHNTRITVLESAVGTGGSVDERIAAEATAREAAVSAETTRATAAEENLRTLYNNLQQSQPIPVTELPATGETGKIYRLAGDTSYADYMWDGTQFMKMAEYDNAIDDEPTAESNNLVKSGGVFPMLALNSMLDRCSLFYGKKMPVVGGGYVNWIENQNINTIGFDASKITSISVKDAPYNTGTPYYGIILTDATLAVLSHYNSEKELTSEELVGVNYVFVTMRGKAASSYLPTKIVINGCPFNVDGFIEAFNKAYNEQSADERENIETLLSAVRIPVLFTGGFYININGVVSQTENLAYGCTDFIRVEPNTEYVSQRGGDQNFYNAYYDSNKNLIDVYQGNTFTTPYNACYIRLSSYRGDKNWNIPSWYYPKYAVSAIFDRLNRGSQNRDKIVCYGDSLTQGAGEDITRNLSSVLSTITSMGYDVSSITGNCNYPRMIQTLVGNKCVIDNEGVGGENVLAIACREGANPMIVNSPFILPSDGSAVNVSRSSLKYAWEDLAVDFSFQANRYNPCYIMGIPCNISKVDNDTYAFRRILSGNRNIDVSVGESVFFRGINLRRPKVLLIWVGANGGYSSVDDYVEKVNKMIKVANAENYLVISHFRRSPNMSLEDVNNIRMACIKQFGLNFFDFQQYVTTNALYDFGIAPTTDSDFTPEQLANGVLSDVYCMQNGIMPSSLWRYVYGVDGSTVNDYHMNAAGYAILGYKLFERMQNMCII